ncbi:OprD family outer membrane porin [Nitrogeniibacter aestuarii]|uniref:OprD family outer membrane porin n=1 Tax=Nitrogeniibacter aestuarii TaxID=2815343 RepID=UPI001E2E6A4E|nr:OprD family outer membrane porin [Nitrogeniibacter aestuarii]
MKVQSKRAVALLVSTLAVVPGLTHAAEQSGHMLELKARGIHFDRSFEDSSKDRTQSALGLQLNYESPYLADVIGVGISGYSVTRLGSSGPEATDILSTDSDGDYHDSFGKIGQAFIKVKYQDLLQAKLGRQVYNSMLLFSSTSRAIPASYSGGSGVVTPMKGLSFYGAMFNEWSARADSSFERLRTDRSVDDEIDYVGLIGAKFEQGPVAVNVEYLHAKDYLSKFGLVGSYTFSLAEKSALKLTAGLHTSRDDGKLFLTGSESDQDDEDKYAKGARSDNDGQGVYLQADWNHGALTLGAAVAKFDGLWIEDNFAGDHGQNPFPTGGVLADMTNRDETVWMVRGGYDWKELVNGVKTTVSYKSGSGARNSHVASLGEADEDEVEANVFYAVPAVKGLKVRYRYLKYTADKTGRVDGVKSDGTDHRLYIDYTYRFF